jgi:hypothetical protein
VARTLQQQLDDVDAAIARIEGGAQSYTVSGAESGVSYTRADLAELYKQRDRLQAAVNRGTTGGIRTRLARPLG